MAALEFEGTCLDICMAIHFSDKSQLDRPSRNNALKERRADRRISTFGVHGVGLSQQHFSE
jgi:hypothetical protein